MTHTSTPLLIALHQNAYTKERCYGQHSVCGLSCHWVVRLILTRSFFAQTLHTGMVHSQYGYVVVLLPALTRKKAAV